MSWIKDVDPWTVVIPIGGRLLDDGIQIHHECKVSPWMEVVDWREMYEELLKKIQGDPMMDAAFEFVGSLSNPPRPGAYWVKGHWRGVTQTDSTTKPVTLPYNGVTVWYCEGCGRPVSHYPCIDCGYPESKLDITLYRNETNKPVLITGIDLSQYPPKAIIKQLDESDSLGPTL